MAKLESVGDIVTEMLQRLPEKYRTHAMEYAAKSPKERAQETVDTLNRSEGTLNQNDGYDCPVCKNKGLIAALVADKDADGNEINWREITYPCKCQKTRVTLANWKKSGLGELVRKCKFENYTTEKDWQKSVKEAAMAFLQDENHNAFFFGGSSGCGKTTICTAMAAHYLRKGKDVIYMIWKDDIKPLNSAVNDAGEFDRIMAKYREAEVLYIDDFWKTTKDRDGEILRPEKGETQRAYELLNYRFSNPNLITIISSERYISEIAEHDEATGSRIYEQTKNGYCFNIKRDPANNYRLRGMKLMG